MDEDTFELTKRRLADEVRDTVRKQLFRTYALIGGAVIAVLGFLSFDLMEEIKSEAHDIANLAVSREVDQIREKLDDLEAEVHQQTGSIRSAGARVTDIYGDVNKQLRLLSLEADNLTNLNESVEALNDARRQVEKKLVVIKGQGENLSVLTTELKTLATELKRIDAPNTTEYQGIINNIEDAEEAAQAAGNLTTVHLQFAGGQRRQAVKLSGLLASKNFFMPGEERHVGAAGIREIRYFHVGDLPEAESLKRATTQALEEMEYANEPIVNLVPMTAYQGVKPKKGVLELWLEL